MAKQDLVVKLLLDSGAFGNDLRQAERRAKEFSDKMKSVGDTAGGFGREIGLTAGAFGKLGGILTGAGGVIAAVGAFKSVMMSSHDSAKKFQGVISGFGGVLESLQYSFSTFDFTNFNKGLRQVYENAKQAKQAVMDAQLSAIAYNVIDKDTRLKLKQYESEYRDTKTTPERREEIVKLRDDLLNKAGETAAQHAENLYESILKQLIGKNSNIGDLEGDIKKTKELIPFEELRRIMLDASMDIIFDADEALKDKWAQIQAQMTKLDISADSNASASDAYMYNAPPAWLEFLPWVKKSREKWKQAQNQSGADAKKARAEWEKLVMEYQELMIKNVLFTIGEEPLSKLTSDMENALNVQAAVEELKLQAMGWSAPSTGSTGGSTGGKKKIEFKNASSISYIRDMVSWTEKYRETLTPLSNEWYDVSDSLNAYKTELAELEKMQKEYDAQYATVIPDTLEVKNVASIGYIQEQISWLEQLRNTLTVGSVEWIEASDCIEAYKDELEELLKFQTAYDEQYDKPIEKFNDMNLAISSSISLLNSLGNAFADSDNAASKAMGSILGMMSSVSNGILEFVQIQQAAAAASGTASAAGLPFPYNLAAIATVMSTVVSVFANIKSMTAGKFAEGGIVGGTSFSGDKLFAMVNSGEMILNKRQQGNLANMIGGGGQVEFHISGDSLVGVLNNKRNKTNLTR